MAQLSEPLFLKGRTSRETYTGILKTLVLADAMARLPAERTEFSPGEEVYVHILSNNLDMLEG